MRSNAPPQWTSLHLRRLSIVLSSIAVLLVGGSLLVTGKALSPPGSGKVLSADLIARSLAEAEAQSSDGSLPLGFRVLRELSHPDGQLYPSDLLLTPEVLSRLVGSGMGMFLREHISTESQAASAGTTTVSLQGLRDNTLYETGAGDLSSGAGASIFSGRTGSMAGNTIRRALLSYDVAAGIPGAATILSAEIEMFCTRSNGGSQPASWYRVSSDWGEGTSDAGDPGGAGAPATPNDATWLHTFYPSSFWGTVGGDFSASISAQTNVSGVGPWTWTSAQLAADVLDMRDSPGTNFGWVLLGNESSLNTSKRFDGKGSSNPGTRPVLRVTVSGVDLTPPSVTWILPASGTMLTPEAPVTLQWSASDPSGVSFIDLLASYDGGTTFFPFAVGLPGTETSYQWTPPTRPGPVVIRLASTDGAMNSGTEDLAATLLTSMNSTVASTMRDFDQPGTQPFEHGLDTQSPLNCSACHGGYDDETEPFFGWSGSMMANAARDPLFEACLAISEQDAEGSGDLCLRCHIPKAWLEGRSVPTDGSAVEPDDRIGVSCDHCHRMLDPQYQAGVSPAEDQDIIAGLITGPPNDPGTGRFVLDPAGTRRGPFDDAVCDQVAHPFLTSPYHNSSKMCGTCHNVSNPNYEYNGAGSYIPLFDLETVNFGHGSIFPIERTYSEWLFSDYNSPGGVYAPQFGGNKDFVSSCQDCHMRDTTGSGCNPSLFPTAPVRDDLPMHDLTGGNTWIPSLIDQIYPGEVDPVALAATIDRARYMLRNAAKLESFYENGLVRVRITNETGHKLPTGYPEGRRMWLNVKFLDASGQLVGESGAYDFGTAVLTEDSEAKIYEVKLGLDDIASAHSGLPAAESFHFILNNMTYKDNRIPPRGFTNLNFAQFGGLPVGYFYPNGAYWDDTTYDVPEGATRAIVRLYYQTTSKEYIEFLRDENVTNSAGQDMYDLWEANGKCPPELMARSVCNFRDVEFEVLPGTPGPGRGITR